MKNLDKSQRGRSNVTREKKIRDQLFGLQPSASDMTELRQTIAVQRKSPRFKRQHSKKP